MKILFFTDTHIRGINPKNRTDNFLESLENKFNEVIKIVEEEKIDFVLHGGDLFDRPDLSISIINNFSKIINKIRVPIYMVSGNHDIFGHNPKTVNRTVLGLLDTLDIVKLIDHEEKIILEKDQIRVQLTASPYIYDIDSYDKREFYMVNDIDESVNYSIHMVHGFLLDKPFIQGIAYTLIDDIKDTKADITLAGHYHSGFKTMEIDGKFFINPGSLVRITNSLREIDRMPKVIIIELKDKISIEERFLESAQPGSQVLDRSEIEKSSFRGEIIAEFKQNIDSALDFDKMDINEVLIKVSQAENIGNDVIKEALRRISISQMKDLDGD